MPSVAEVIELQRHVEGLGAQGRDGLLQVITLLAGDAHLFTLDGGLDFQLGILDMGHDFLRQLLVDAFLEDGIDKELAKKIVAHIKDAKLKVQAAIQGEQVRVTGKKRDDLQEAIASLRAKTFDMPLQFNNFRD